MRRQRLLKMLQALNIFSPLRDHVRAIMRGPSSHALWGGQTCDAALHRRTDVTDAVVARAAFNVISDLTSVDERYEIVLRALTEAILAVRPQTCHDEEHHHEFQDRFRMIADALMVRIASDIDVHAIVVRTLYEVLAHRTIPAPHRHWSALRTSSDSPRAGCELKALSYEACAELQAHTAMCVRCAANTASSGEIQ